ncbi:MAG: hypothetical protein IK012_13120 [Fibrobacter sp.]|uniref:FISUMP domain-containing protein n=1 Tax=Fibrobacter sp. TaxID=35828 RepID=UPI0025BB5C77|nr:FISUMP domain-containing protein [Fibrobacter sp.]MBR4786173.1 hypothetical protein [Fibrobacter sp.]
MDKMVRNALMRDYIGAAFCLVMAFVLLVLGTGCSDDKPVSGGSAEETGIMAELENITIEAAARSVVLQSPDGDSLQEGAFAMEGYASRSVAWLYELDSVNFAETGVSYSDTLQNSGDKFKFKNVTLKSPYVMVRVFGKSISGYGGNVLAIVDVRKTKDVNLNLLTTLKTSLWRYLAKESSSHDSLDMRAEIATLEALGITCQFNEFESKKILENSDYVMAEAAISIMLTYDMSHIERASVNPILEVLEADGNLDNLDSTIKERFENRLAHALKGNRSYSSMRVDVLDSLALGEDVKSFYCQRQTFMRLLTDVYVKLAGAGHCTEAREGETLEFPDRFKVAVTLACRSGGWRVEFGKEGNELPETGTMTDARDGRTYKTVTYNIDGKPQTWMAENLKYAYGNSHCLADDERQCEVFGRLYTWREAMALDTSILWDKEDCMGYYRAELDTCAATVKNLLDGDTTKIDSLCGNDAEITAICEEEMLESNIYARYNFHRAMELMDSVNHQGVCPEGWHVATIDDWNGLTTYIRGMYRRDEIAWYLLQTEYTDGAVGFGMRLMLAWDEVGDYHVNIKVGKKSLRPLYIIYPSYATPVYKRDDVSMVEPSYLWSIDSAYELSPEYGNMWSMREGNMTNWHDYYGEFAVVEFSNQMWSEKNSPVRCVKN